MNNAVDTVRGSVSGSAASPASSTRHDLAAFWGPALPSDRAPRVMGLFAHPDDEVFCVGGTIARCADAGAVTAIASLTHGESGQIRDAAAATRRTLGSVRFKELHASASALGVDEVTCLDLGDGRLATLPLAEIVSAVRNLLQDFAPDVVVTFGPDGGFGHPDHVASCIATVAAVASMAEPPRLLHACFPAQGQLMVSLLVDWLASQDRRFKGTTEFVHALRMFADGTSMLGFASDHIRVEWFPPGTYIIEQGEPSTELFCILSGTADIVVERDDGNTYRKDTTGAGCFVGEDGLLSGRPRNAHVVARDDVTCLVFSPARPNRVEGRGAGAAIAPPRSISTRLPWTTPPLAALMGTMADSFEIDVRSMLDRKVAALAAHRSQYALEPDLLPASMLERMLGTERFVVAGGR